ncbi:phosphatidylinositol 4 5-bisphosphate 3-kinase catalytic subunit delta isoform-like isoform X2 [Biomphalaria pfeifferi]|uniref:phosphatidylinositol 3-kinase n=1 Tax=Biomphalaria pfeifferi TaxID=112525 RepID=A0AAD8BV50_BIOPF|nr:phosphatidylinositol 4 5-bisphosphate 3-kinase catalytic subunit delta isoform-like isoform X2 [Biomphalaria pfeifferi]
MINLPDFTNLEGMSSLPSIKCNMDINNQVLIDFLFPTGIMISKSVNLYSPIDQIKQVIWREAQKFPLANKLLQEEAYYFSFINIFGEKEEVLDESQNLEQLQPLFPYLQLVEKNVDSSPQQILTKKINSLIGRGFQKQESFQAAEISDFKCKMSELCTQISTQRRSQTTMEKFEWRYPLRLRGSDSVPAELTARTENREIVVDIGFNVDGICYKLKVDLDGTPDEAIQRALIKRRNATGVNIEDSDDYILKVIGQEEYIYGNYPLIRFKYVYQCLVKKIAPQFWMVKKSKLPESTPPVPRRPTIVPRSPMSSGNENMLVTEVKSNYRIQLVGIDKVQLPDISKIKLYIGLYHGAEALCKEIETYEMPVMDGSCTVRADIVFDIKVADLPLAARLCFALYHINTNKREDLSCWVNIPVYDFKERLQRGDRELPMWPHDVLQQPEEHCNPIGGVAVNAVSMDATLLKINFPDFDNKGGSYLIYPPYDKILQCAAENMEPSSSIGSPCMKVSKSHVEQLTQALYQSEQLCEQDKDLIWTFRYEVQQKFPNFLSKVLQSVKWNSYIDVAKITTLLQIWKPLPVDYALEILDYEYPDRNVREFAVRCLDSELSDDDVAQYMLQLVQALKFETHLCCSLAKFLLTRALKNQHLGHKLFWLLRSETHNSTVSTQYSLILQIYLKHNNDHLAVLMKQQDALKKLSALNSLIKECDINDDTKRQNAKTLIQEVLRQPNYMKFLTDLSSPLSPLYKMKDLKIDNCKFMNSKKRPLWLVWSNEDSMGPDIQIIYKNGDDLRQDMLTLQILQVMDNIWQAEGLDFRMNPYMCMATDLQQGMIEVVTSADTMANIQKWYKKTAFDKKALFEWLKSKHQNEESLNTAVDEFTLSCAGYCVATYVLGIGDRHNDNIMMKTSGQMFHIDFGHFLGNFKTKFNVKRERVPFVLTSHFVYVITKGGTNPDNFQKFQTMCEKAYLAVRQKYPLLVSLFMMMLSGGIPQLTSPKDVNYLKETLVPHMTEADARSHFRGKFKEALLGSWKSSVNFFFHMKAK